jgi:hypothetical protein
MLFMIVRHHAGDFAGVTANTLQVIGHNKTIHKGTCSGSINPIFYKNIDDPDSPRQWSFAQVMGLMTTSLRQINLFHRR